MNIRTFTLMLCEYYGYDYDFVSLCHKSLNAKLNLFKGLEYILTSFAS
jgi:hypothetical protein